jgi:hypothetical protein
MKALPGSGVLIQGRNGWFLARTKDDKVTITPVGDVEITERVYAMDDWPTGGVLIGADKGLFLARETNGNVTIAPVGAADTGYVHVIHALPEGGALIGSRKGWFVARETGGKLTLTPAGQGDGSRVNHMRDFGGAVLIGGESGLFVATAAPGCGGR